MSQQVLDIDTVGNKHTLGSFYDFHVNNTFYLLAPEYYYSFYSIYLNRCLAAYDGYMADKHNIEGGLVPQGMLQSIATGLNNMLFAHGIDFNGESEDYYFAVKWAKQTKFYAALKKAHKFAIAGGTSLLKVNRSNKELFCTAHRIDTFFADVDSSGRITSVKVFFDAFHNTNAEDNKEHYGICEERYFNAEGMPCITATVYKSSGNLQTSVADRQSAKHSQRVKWENLNPTVRQYIKEHYPSIIVDEEQYLPFANSLGVFLIKFTDDIPKLPTLPFGQPIGDILFTESWQYDQIKYFEKNEVDLARARALIPEEMWNKDDPAYEDRALSDRFYQKVGSINADDNKVTPIQFNLRGNDIKTVEENIYKACSFKLQVSASSIASFLSEGAGARTATEIVNERTKTDTWIDSQVNLNSPEINQALKEIMLYYNHRPVEIVFKTENQTPEMEALKTCSDVFTARNMSPELFVRKCHRSLSEVQQQKEIRYLEESLAQNDAMKQATMTSWQGQQQV